VLGLYLTARLLTPGPIDPGLAENPQNPLGVESAEGLLRLVQTLAGVAAPVLALAALASVVLRFRRARGEERQQLKWFAFVVAADLVLIPGVGEVAQRVAPVAGELVVFPVGLSMIPVAIGVAVLKYRLYDIDRVINRTLVYGLLTVLLGAVYTGGVFGLGQLLNPVTGESALAVAASTLAVAALFQPARPASKRSWIAASTGGATTRPRPSGRSAPGCAIRSTSIPSRLNCWLWWTRPWSRRGCRCGCGPGEPLGPLGH
jgi:hypothetical protein